jgi:hypothetical protein
MQQCKQQYYKLLNISWLFKKAKMNLLRSEKIIADDVIHTSFGNSSYC